MLTVEAGILTILIGFLEVLIVRREKERAALQISPQVCAIEFLPACRNESEAVPDSSRLTDLHKSDLRVEPLCNYNCSDLRAHEKS